MIVDGTTHQTAAVPVQQNPANGAAKPRSIANEPSQGERLASSSAPQSTTELHDSFEHVSEGASAVPYRDGASGRTRDGVVGGAFEAAREILDKLKGIGIADLKSASNATESPLLPKPGGTGILAQDILKAYGVAGAQTDKNSQGGTPADLLDTLG